MKIAILGGSGKLGRGLAARLHSQEVLIGSRDPSKGVPYREASAGCDLAIITVPYSAQQDLLASLKVELTGKIVIDAIVPLNPSDPTQIRTATGMSAAEEAAEAIPGAHVFAAFQTVSHRVLMRPEAVTDILVAGGSVGREVVLDLIRTMNLRPVSAGALVMAASIERLTALLISINKTNKVKESSIRIDGLQ